MEKVFDLISKNTLLSVHFKLFNDEIDKCMFSCASEDYYRLEGMLLMFEYDNALSRDDLNAFRDYCFSIAKSHGSYL